MKNVTTMIWRRGILAMVFLVLGGLLAETPRAAAIDRARLQQANRAQQPQPEDQPAERDRSDRRILPPRLPGPQWTLGVRVDNLQTGVRLAQVFPGTAAWRVGLEVQDIIVSVDGYQVGYVQRRLYDLETELNLRAGRSGWVRLLVWNHRDGQLVNVDALLDRSRPPGPRPKPQPAGIRGTVTFQAAVTADPDTVVIVRLVDITRPLSGIKTIAEQRIPFTGQVPVPFRLDIGPDQLSPDRRYALQSQLLSKDRRVLANDPAQYLLKDIGNQAVEIKLKPVRFDK